MTMQPSELLEFDPSLQVRALQGENSLGFLEHVFECYAQGRPFAIMRPDLSLEAYGLASEQIALPKPPARGWGHAHYGLAAPQQAASLAQIVFTSGTEGLPKAMVLSRGALDNVVERLNRVMQVTSEIREYIGVPVTYSFGLGRARAVAAAGGKFFLPERFDPTEIRRMLEADEINAISAVPSLWKMLLSAPEGFAKTGDKLRWIEIGSQYMSGADKAQLRALFPNAKIVQHYGLTEASRSTFLDISEASEAQLESVGPANDPAGGVEIKLNEDGAICIRGPHVALGQLRPGPTAQLQKLTDDQGWLVTKDQGRLQGGFLFYGGRLDDQINIGGVKVAAETLERDITALVPGAAGHIAATALPDPTRGEVVGLGIEASVGDTVPLIMQAATLVLARAGVTSASAVVPLEIDTLPRTQTHKIQRRALRDHAPEILADKQAAPSDGPVADLTETESKVAQSWQKILGVPPKTAAQSFYDMGGDSLSSVQVGLVMESDKFNSAAIRATLEGQSLSEIARLAGAQTPTMGITALPDHTARNWAINVARGIMVLSVLLSHWGPGLFERLQLSDWADRYVNIIYRMGTPGFAAVFGIGVGAFMLPKFAQNRMSVLKRARMSFWLVFSGIIFVAVIVLVLFALQGKEIDGGQIGLSLHSVLAYYAVALLTAPLWLRALAQLKRPALSLPLIALLVWASGQVFNLVITNTPQDTILELPRLLLKANYNIFKMSFVALLGASIGYWFVHQKDTRRAAQTLFVAGASGGALCLALGLQAYGLDAFAGPVPAVFNTLPQQILYTALAAMMTGGFTQLLLRWQGLRTAWRWPLKLLIVFGGLALPIYVFHGLVIPVKDILVLLGWPGSVSFALPMGAFLFGMGYAGRRLYRMYFAR